MSGIGVFYITVRGVYPYKYIYPDGSAAPPPNWGEGGILGRLRNLGRGRAK